MTDYVYTSSLAHPKVRAMWWLFCPKVRVLGSKWLGLPVFVGMFVYFCIAYDIAQMWLDYREWRRNVDPDLAKRVEFVVVEWR